MSFNSFKILSLFFVSNILLNVLDVVTDVATAWNLINQKYNQYYGLIGKVH